MPGTDVPNKALDVIETRIEEISTEYGEDVKRLDGLIKKNGDTATKEISDLSAMLDGIAPKLKALQDEQARLKGIIARVEAGMDLGDEADEELEGESKLYRLAVSKRFSTSEIYKDWKGDRRNAEKDIDLVRIGSFWDRRTLKAFETARKRGALLSAIQRKADPTQDGSNLGSLVHPFFLPGIVELPQFMPVLRQLIPVVDVTSDQVNIDREKSLALLITFLTADVIATATTADLQEVGGWEDESPFNVIKFDDGTNSQTVTITDITDSTITFTPQLADGYSKDNTKMTAEHFTTTDEGLLSPFSEVESEAVLVPIATLTTSRKITLQKLRDIPMLEQWISTRMMRAIARMEDFNFFYGNNPTGKGIKGFFKDPDITTLAAFSTFPGGTNIFDYIAEAVFGLADDNYEASAAVVSVAIRKLMVTAKGSDGHYLLIPVERAGATDLVTALDVRVSNALVPTDGLVSDFRITSLIFDRQDSEIDVGTEDKDLRNRKRTMVAHNRVGLGIELPTGIKKLNADALP